ncbi:hypothetical protein MMC08_000475 [Hypocenomyce scalaris]|nr:hypothetical protein [Hypocenomyce scalaris]
MSSKKKEPTNRLAGTSQGGKKDLPPEAWIVDELRQFGAIETGKKWNLTLGGKVHTMFDKKRWKNIEPKRLDALEQSFLLGTKLLAVGGPYLCNFLPDQKFAPTKKKTTRTNHGFDEADVRRLIVNDARTQDEIDAANNELVGIAESIQWEEHPKMLPKTSRWGLNHTSYTVEEGDTKVISPDEPLTEDPKYDWDEARERAQEAGERHRQITITVASQYVDAILASPDDSDQHLVAVFLAAINMVHELGHTLCYHDLRSDCDEFWVGNDIFSEIGDSFIAWLFDGWYPEGNDLGKDKDLYAMRTGIHWMKQHRMPLVKPRATYAYSVPLAHIQRILDECEWSKFDSSKDSPQIRQELLRPKTPFKNGEHARTSRLLGGFSWITAVDVTERDEGEDTLADKTAIDEDWADGSESSTLIAFHHLHAKLTSAVVQEATEIQTQKRQAKRERSEGFEKTQPSKTTRKAGPAVREQMSTPGGLYPERGGTKKVGTPPNVTEKPGSKGRTAGSKCTSEAPGTKPTAGSKRPSKGSVTKGIRTESNPIEIEDAPAINTRSKKRTAPLLGPEKLEEVVKKKRRVAKATKEDPVTLGSSSDDNGDGGKEDSKGEKKKQGEGRQGGS